MAGTGRRIQPHSISIDRTTFDTATVVLFVNIVPVLVIPYLWILYTVGIPLHAFVGLILLLRPGASGLAGLGVLIGLLTATTTVGVSVLIFNTGNLR